MSQRLTPACVVVVLTIALGACSSTPATSPGSSTAASASAGVVGASELVSQQTANGLLPTDLVPASATAAPEATVTGRKLSDLKVAFFESHDNNSYVQVRAQAAKDWAALTGASVQIFNPQGDATLQYSQMQTAFANKQYNGYVMTSVIPGPLCELVTEAVESGALISVMNQPLCGRADALGAELKLPGTVTFVGGQTADVYNEWAQYVLEQNPRGGTFAAMFGPATDANSQNFNAAIDKYLVPNGFEEVASAPTDQGTPASFAAAQDILQAHPKLDFFLSNWSGQTQGIVQAIKTAGRTGIKVYDLGGTSWARQALRDGEIESTVAFLPYLEGARAIEALATAYLGIPVPPFINLARDPSLPGGTAFMTKATVDQYPVEGDY